MTSPTSGPTASPASRPLALKEGDARVFLDAQRLIHEEVGHREDRITGMAADVAVKTPKHLAVEPRREINEDYLRLHRRLQTIENGTSRWCESARQ